MELFEPNPGVSGGGRARGRGGSFHLSFRVGLPRGRLVRARRARLHHAQRGVRRSRS